MTEHPKECAWHVDQYPWECTCGLVYRQHRDRIEALTAENERLREALEEWVFRYAWKAEGMNTEQARIHAKAFMARAALEGKQ